MAASTLRGQRRHADHLWLNQGGARFTETRSRAAWPSTRTAPKAGMGVHAADVDDDGDNDLLVMNLDTESDSFFRNDGAFFVDATSMVGLRVTSRRFTRFGMGMADFDNDGRLDLYEANGRVGLQGETFANDPYAEPNLLFRGVAGAKFEEVTPRGGTAAPLIATSRAAAFGDIDNDGGVDVLVANRDAAPYLLRNVVAARGHWAQFAVKTAHGRDALGARLAVTAGGRTWRRCPQRLQLPRGERPARARGRGRGDRHRGRGRRVARRAVEPFGPFGVDAVVTLRQNGGTPRPAAAPTAPR
jgi:hypothetical protein